MSILLHRNKAEEELSGAYETAEATLPGSAPVKALRKKAIASFTALGLPNRRIEEWKYTDLRNALKTVAPLATGALGSFTAADLEAALGELATLDAHRVVFVNGRHVSELSSKNASKGLDIKPLAAALADAPEKVATVLASARNSDDNAIVALNTALMTDGAVIRIGDRANIEKPVLLVYAATGDRAELVAVRNIVVIGTKAKAMVIEAHVALSGSVAENGQTNALTEVTVADDAHFAHVKVANGSGSNVHLSNWNVALATDATYRGFQFTTGQSIARNQVNVIYGGEGGKLDVSGAYLIRGKEHVDTTLIIDHAVPRCESRELFKGVIGDQGRGIFQGKVIVRPDAQKTDGKQMSQALMLSPDAEFDSKPELEIYADDVVCGHGTTSAELDQDLLFYCKSRGIPDNEARALLIESFIGEALDKVEHEGLREALTSMAFAWLKDASSA